MDIEKSIKNLKGLTFETTDDIIPEIESDEEIMITKQEGMMEDYQIYEDIPGDTPTIGINVEDNEDGTQTIIKAYKIKAEMWKW